MSTKVTLRFKDKEGELPDWYLYEELLEADDVIYLELDGIKADVTMIDGPWSRAGTVLPRLPAATARQLGLVPSDWKRDNKWSRSDIESGIGRLRRQSQETDEEGGPEEP
ncbi:hypothetical protein M3I54_25055 [Paraburkholderia sp. CNPSo 3274]|uniref:hypothetical protein n=1 Tax=Paraburkholderia sp. CNPSo 3274 TaxID=2940932 RepID=UPI0020B7ED32|nr:hypothetical protein [Paraburkholderia sp. CNPSo 3274]MCP3710195.1 hypothetical protein [Paraburkholderia sp. CNPSo 3274]